MESKSDSSVTAQLMFDWNLATMLSISDCMMDTGKVTGFCRKPNLVLPSAQKDKRSINGAASRNPIESQLNMSRQIGVSLILWDCCDLCDVQVALWQESEKLMRRNQGCFDSPVACVFGSVLSFEVRCFMDVSLGCCFSSLKKFLLVSKNSERLWWSEWFTLLSSLSQHNNRETLGMTEEDPG